MHDEQVVVVSFFRSADACKHCLNIINAFLVKYILFYNHYGKTRFSCQRTVCETLLKYCVTRDWLPCLKPRSFSQPQMFLLQFGFHETRLTDNML